MTDSIVRTRRANVPRPLIYGGAAVAVLGAVWWTRHKRAASVPTDASAVDAGAVGASDTGYDTSGFSDYSPAPAYGGPGGTTTGIEPTMPAPPRTNAEWTQQSEQYLVQSGFDPVSAAIALGVYLASGALTQSQYNMVTASLAGVGLPPVQPAPPHIIPPTGQKPPTPHPTSGGLKGAPHLVVASQTKTAVVLSWTKVSGATHYRIYRLDGKVLRDVVGTRAAVARVSHHETVHVTAYRYTRQYSAASNAVGINQR